MSLIFLIKALFIPLIVYFIYIPPLALLNIIIINILILNINKRSLSLFITLMFTFYKP